MPVTPATETASRTIAFRVSDLSCKSVHVDNHVMHELRKRVLLRQAQGGVEDHVCGVPSFTGAGPRYVGSIDEVHQHQVGVEPVFCRRKYKKASRFAYW